MVVPQTIQDLQSLFDDYFFIRRCSPGAGECAADNFYLPDATWSNHTIYRRNLYNWQPNHNFEPGNNNDWVYTYLLVYRANIVLDNIDLIKRSPGDQDEWNNTKGSALFYRAKSFLEAAWVWSLAYDESTAASDLGIPLRLSSNLNTPSVRSSVKDTYDRILADLKEAAALLPLKPLHVLRPSKPAAWAMLARTYLSMRQYDKVWLYADSCLQVNNTLMDYNGSPYINPAASYRISRFNPEVIFDAGTVFNQLFSNGLVDSVLYASYSANDWRKTLYYRLPNQTIGLFRGNYANTDLVFTGIATDELYLLRAEAAARKGDIQEAMNDLNTLLIKRYKTGTFTPLSANTKEVALQLILTERRKELAFRCLRWMDIKRLNKEGAGIVLKRVINGTVISLPANDLRFALPIPEDVITISGIPQNPR